MLFHERFAQNFRAIRRRRRMGDDRSPKLARTEHDRDHAASEIGGLEFVHEIAEQRVSGKRGSRLVPRLHQHPDEVLLAPTMVRLAGEVRCRRKRAAHDFIALRGQIDFIAAGVAGTIVNLVPRVSSSMRGI